MERITKVELVIAHSKSMEMTQSIGDYIDIVEDVIGSYNRQQAAKQLSVPWARRSACALKWQRLAFITPLMTYFRALYSAV